MQSLDRIDTLIFIAANHGTPPSIKDLESLRALLVLDIGQARREGDKAPLVWPPIEVIDDE